MDGELPRRFAGVDPNSRAFPQSWKDLAIRLFVGD